MGLWGWGLGFGVTMACMGAVQRRVGWVRRLLGPFHALLRAERVAQVPCPLQGPAVLQGGPWGYQKPAVP